MVRTESVIDVRCARYFTVLQKTPVAAIVILSVVWYKINCCPKETLPFSHKKRVGRGRLLRIKLEEKHMCFVRRKTI